MIILNGIITEKVMASLILTISFENAVVKSEKRYCYSTDRIKNISSQNHTWKECSEGLYLVKKPVYPPLSLRYTVGKISIWTPVDFASLTTCKEMCDL